jgi:hypothetical protein
MRLHAMRLHRLILTGLATLGVLASGLVLCGAPARAAGEHALLTSFGGSETPAGSFAALEFESGLSGLNDVAVDQSTGDPYVVDMGSGHDVVDVFSSSLAAPANSYLAQLSGFSFADASDVAIDNACYLHRPVALTGGECAAFDPSNGDVYVTDANRAVVDQYSTTIDASGVPSFTFVCELNGSSSPCPGAQSAPFSDPCGVAVDSQGDVYVADYGLDVVDIFNSSGGYVTQIEGVSRPCGVAVDSTGNVYVNKWHEDVVKFSPSSFPATGATTYTLQYLVDNRNGEDGSIANPGSNQFDHGSTAVAVDPSTNDVYVDDNKYIMEYDSSGNPIQQFGLGTISFAPEEEEGGRGGSLGVAVDGASGDVYVADGDIAGSSPVVDLYGPPVAVALNSDTVSGVTSTSATLNGDLNPGGAPGGVTYYFSYGEGTRCGGPGSLTSPAGLATGNGDVSESVSVTGLVPNQRYTYCIAEKTADGAVFGQPVPFTTNGLAPAVDAQSVSGVSREEATLNVRVNPENEDTHYYFQYGTSTSYTGGEVPLPAPGTDLGSAYGDQGASAALSGLAVNTVYHYRVVAVNATGTTYGVDQTFLTLPYAPAVVSALAAASVSGTGATVSGSVNPQGARSGYFVQFGPSEAYGGVSAVADTAPSVGAVPVTVTLEGLRGGSTYHYRLVSQNTGGITYGPDQTFTTPPAPPLVVTGAASAVTSSTATLSGSVDSQGTATSYEFDLGTDTSYGSRVFASAAAGEEVQSVAVEVGALEPGVTYHYRLVATNAFGTTYGADMVFTTPVVSAGVLVSPVAPALLTVPAIAFPAAVVSTVSQPKTKAKPKKRSRPKRKAKARSKAKATKKTRGAGVAGGRGRSGGKGRRGR